ncbi:MAG: YgjV family protein, partial [Pseudomonadota bacterium]
MLSLPYLLAQAFGVVAFGFQVFSARAKERRRLTLFLGLCNVFWVAHYIVLGVPLAAVIAALIAVQLIVSSFMEAKYRRPIIVAFLVLYWIAAFLTVEDAFHLLPAIGSTAMSLSLLLSRSLTQLLPAVGTSVLSLSLLSDRSVIIVRLGAMTSFSMWMAHGFFTGSVIEVLANAVPLTAAFYGLVVHDLGIKPL